MTNTHYDAAKLDALLEKLKSTEALEKCFLMEIDGQKAVRLQFQHQKDAIHFDIFVTYASDSFFHHDVYLNANSRIELEQQGIVPTFANDLDGIVSKLELGVAEAHSALINEAATS